MKITETAEKICALAESCGMSFASNVQREIFTGDVENIIGQYANSLEDPSPVQYGKAHRDV